MNNVESDLEEGEIPDSPSSPCDSDTNIRELPRRYIIKKSRHTRIHKHRKKDCKNAIRYHAKKLAKLKKSPEKLNDNKKHRKSTCPYDKSSKISNNGHSFSKQSLIAEMNGSLKDHSIDNQLIKRKTKIEQNLFKFENKNIDHDKLLREKENFKTVATQINDNNFDDSKQYNQSVQNSENISNNIDVNSDNVKLSNILPSNSPGTIHEESEDEEELRKIALATFSKRKPDAELSNNLTKSEEDIKSLEIISESVSHPEMNNLESDNYEIVDMDVDEDTESAIEVFETPLESALSECAENLFVIDTKPFVEDNTNTLNEFEPIRNSSDEEFEADILRAELIESMYRKKCLLEDDDDGLKQNQQPSVPKKNNVNNHQKPNNKFYHNHLKPKHIVRNTLIRSVNIPYNTSKSIAPNNQLQIGKKKPERLIISLNEESSSEESESEEENFAAEKNVAPENPVASIEALISDCRQKSEFSEKNQDAVKPVSQAVSCLSKAQQEEYQTLMKILAEKEKLPTPVEAVENKNCSINSPLNDLKLVEKKLLKLKDDLRKKNKSLSLLSKDMNSKKLIYMKSKLSAQLLKEQYLAAEKKRKTNLCIWSKSLNDFKNGKRAVLNSENKINQVQTLCFKLGACIQGKTYNLPSLPTNNSNSSV